jgi:hypothetical protein
MILAILSRRERHIDQTRKTEERRKGINNNNNNKKAIRENWLR